MENVEITNPQEQKVERPDSFITRVTDFFIKLMDKFTKGKYKTPEEQAFFADEKNLYDENGQLTPEYQKKIKEYEEFVTKQDVNAFLHETHSTDSEEFGKAYTEEEMAVMDSANDFITDQERIGKELDKAKDSAAMNDGEFDLDTWLFNYLKQQGLQEDINVVHEKIRNMILDELGRVDKDIKDLEGDDVFEELGGINIRKFYQEAINEVLNQKEV